MRLWSIHPKYLDSKRLTAQWREALLCRAVLDGITKGYKEHPHFLRVKRHSQPYYFINSFLYTIWDEGKQRDFKFDKSKLMEEMVQKYKEPFQLMEVYDEQIQYEFDILQKKLGEFHEQYIKNQQNFNESGIEINPCFIKIFGDERWRDCL